MKALFLLLIILNVAYAAKPVEKGTRWDQLMKLVNQEMKILESAKRKGTEIHYRMLELHSEKLKLIHEKNNTAFMEKSKTQNVSGNKESFFKESRDYYNLTKSFGINILKTNPQNNRRAEVLYVLGLNSRDYGRDNIAEKTLLESISLIKDPFNSLRHHAETALADHYYNEKQFDSAIVYYERSIKVMEDEWRTKHLFNLSWCYLKVRNFTKAILNLREAYFQSKNRSYVNIKDQVLENLGSFYVYAGIPLEGLEFYLKNEKDPIQYLMPMALKAMDKGYQHETEKILGSVQHLIDINKWLQYQEELFHTYLDFYRFYNKFEDHERISKNLVDYYQKADSLKTAKAIKLPVNMKDDAIEKMRSLAGFLQIKLAKDGKENEASFKDKDLNIVLAYFNHLIVLDPKRKAEYLYFRAETFYSVRKFAKAAPTYVEAVEESKKAKNMELSRKALNSLLALTGIEILEKNTNKKFLIYAYTEHISFWPRDEKSELIYPKLFSIYRELHDDLRASVLLKKYNAAYPEHLKDQQKMMTQILDQFIEKKDTRKLAYWIGEMKTGFLKFSVDMIVKTEIVLGNILFIQYQQMAKNGNKLEAAKGFESIYVNKLYTDKVKSQSAFFAALTYLEMGETAVSWNWQVLAYGRMTEAEKLERREEQLKIAERTYKLQDFKTSYKLSEFLLKKFCALKDDVQNRFYEIAVMTALVEENTNGAEHIVTDYHRCLKKTETETAALSQIYQHFEKHGDFFGLRAFVKRHPINPYLNQYRYSLQKWYWEKSNLNLKDQIKQEYKALNHPETIAWLKEMSQFETAKSQVEELETAVIWNKAQFDGDEFNKDLEAYLLKLQKFKESYQNLTQSTQVDLAILSTRVFSEVYLTVGERIQGLKPAGMDEQTVKEFQAAMKQLSAQFITASRQFEKQLDKALKEKETLAWGSRSIASVEEVENPVFSFFTGLTMDKSRD